MRKVSTLFVFSVRWVGKEPATDHNELVFYLDPFDVDDFPEVQSLIITSFAPQLFETKSQDPNLKMVQDHVVSWIQFYIRQYEDTVKRAKDAHISNAMTFYKNFFMESSRIMSAKLSSSVDILLKYGSMRNLLSAKRLCSGN
jgi:hypothetical protein